jgi:hypothetical protein
MSKFRFKTISKKKEREKMLVTFLNQKKKWNPIKKTYFAILKFRSKAIPKKKKRKNVKNVLKLEN